MTQKLCAPHNIPEPCLLCAQNAWPVRDLWAVADFAGNPLNGWENGLVPGVKPIRFSEVVRILGRKIREIEEARLEAFKPFYEAKTRIRKEARQVATLHAGKLEIAACYLAQGKPPPENDELVALYMQTIKEDESSW